MSGPFGNYIGQCVGVILSTMYTQEKIPMRITDSVTINSVAPGTGQIIYSGQIFGHYKFIGDTDKLVFNWVEEVYNQHQMMLSDDNKYLTPQFRLQLIDTKDIGLMIKDKHFLTEAFKKFIIDYITNQTTHNTKVMQQRLLDEDFETKPSNSLATVIIYESGKSLTIKCNDESKAQEFIDYLNNNFKYDVKSFYKG